MLLADVVGIGANSVKIGDLDSDDSDAQYIFI